jgi:hypothetical protein
MDTGIITRKRRQLKIGLAVLGFVIAAAFFAYFETDPRPGSLPALWAAGIALVLCPGSLLFVTWLDIEPQTTAFVIMWLVIALVNVALYGAIGGVVGKFRWKADKEGSESPDRADVRG